MASALSWGTGDFCGGLASRYGSVALAIIVSQSFGVTAGVAGIALTGEQAPVAAVFGWAALAGLAGIGGLLFFYRALSTGTMALVAPLAGVVGAVVPASIAIVGGELLSPTRGAGVAVAIVAIVLISVPRRASGAAGAAASHRRLGRADFILAVLAGLGFAGFFLFLDASAGAGGVTWWPMLIIRAVGLSAALIGVGVIAVARRRDGIRRATEEVLGRDRLRASVGRFGLASVLPVFLVAGIGDLGGNLFFLFADQNDALSVAVVLSSLYPVITALLAAILLRERLGPAQWAGVGLAAVAAALIGIG